MAGDLNLKKSWHPGLMRNQEAVWKREQEALEERKKIAERQREIEEERERNELMAMHEAAGGKKRTDRVEWMYATPQGGNMGVTDEVQAFLLGKNTVEELLQQSEGMGSLKEEQDSFMATENNSSSSKDLASKVREDPMLAIKKEQQQVLNALKNNPTRLRALKAARAEQESSDDRRYSAESRDRYSRDAKIRNPLDARSRERYSVHKDSSLPSSSRHRHSHRRNHDDSHSHRSESKDRSHHNDRDYYRSGGKSHDRDHDRNHDRDIRHYKERESRNDDYGHRSRTKDTGSRDVYYDNARHRDKIHDGRRHRERDYDHLSGNSHARSRLEPPAHRDIELRSEMIRP
ncbi:Pre-mRNA splicing factor-domain-containing protein [Dipodascopsis uninucleata]